MYFGIALVFASRHLQARSISCLSALLGYALSVAVSSFLDTSHEI
jgi:hypothetical protein